MKTDTLIRKEVKKYIDTADDKVVRMLHAMLEADADDNWFDAMPANVKADLKDSIAEADAGKLIPHQTLKK